jgi:sugar phosphate isomerase/epimerase
MNLGLFTGCLPHLSLDDVAAWAASAGFDALEIGAWPADETRDGASCHLDVYRLDDHRAAEVHAVLAKHALTPSAICYYENNLHGDEERRHRIHQHLRACIDAAALLGVPHVGTFVGRDTSRTVKENLELADTALRPLIDHATARGVRLVIENCPMEGWHPDGYPANLAYSPELWEWMFTLGLYLNYDPSHLAWLGIDPIQALTDYSDRVLHVQAKDVQIIPQARNRYGTYGKTAERTGPFDAGWWRYRLPGLGELDWRRLIDVLYEVGYQGTVSVEHEDTVWSGTEDNVKRGLLIAQRTLRPLIIA